MILFQEGKLIRSSRVEIAKYKIALLHKSPVEVVVVGYEGCSTINTRSTATFPVFVDSLIEMEWVEGDLESSQARQ